MDPRTLRRPGMLETAAQVQRTQVTGRLYSYNFGFW